LKWRHPGIWHGRFTLWSLAASKSAKLDSIFVAKNQTIKATGGRRASSKTWSGGRQAASVTKLRSLVMAFGGKNIGSQALRDMAKQ